MAAFATVRVLGPQDAGLVPAAVRVLGPRDAGLVLAAMDVFDTPPDPRLTADFLADPRHHMVGAIAGDALVGMASAVDYVHPDKPRTLWINEVGVADAWLRQGVGLAVVQAMLGHGRGLGCREAWVLVDADNAPARALYARAGGAATGRDPLMVSFDLTAEAIVAAG